VGGDKCVWGANEGEFVRAEVAEHADLEGAGACRGVSGGLWWFFGGAEEGREEEGRGAHRK